MKNRVVGFLLIAVLAVVAYASGAAARNVVGLVSDQTQTRLESSPGQGVDHAPRSELLQPAPPGPAPISWRLSSPMERTAFEKQGLLNISAFSHQQIEMSSTPAGDLAWDCTERSATPSFFIAGVLVEGQVKRTEGTINGHSNIFKGY